MVSVVSVSVDACRKFNGHSLRVNCVERGASGDVLFTGGYDRLVVAHDLRARAEIQTLPICKDSVESLLVVGHDILASDANGCVYHHDVRAGSLRIDNYHAPIGHMSVSPDGRCLALSCQDGRVRLVERATGLLLGTFAGSHVTTDYKIGCTFVDQGRTVGTKRTPRLSLLGTVCCTDFFRCVSLSFVALPFLCLSAFCSDGVRKRASGDVRRDERASARRAATTGVVVLVEPP